MVVLQITHGFPARKDVHLGGVGVGCGAGGTRERSSRPSFAGENPPDLFYLFFLPI